jgi:hypothetical protein
VCSFQVAELEEQVREVTAQRRQAERAATEVLATLESQGFGAHLLSDADDDSGSDRDGEVDDEDTKCRGDTVRAPGEEESAAQGDADDAMSGTAQPGGLSWKGRSVSPRRARQLMQKHRRSYFCLPAVLLLRFLAQVPDGTVVPQEQAADGHEVPYLITTRAKTFLSICVRSFSST